MSTNLDCGHEPSPHSSCTTGTAHTPDNREICWDCAHAWQVAELKSAREVFAYFTPEKGITDWPGGHLMRLVSSVKRHVGFGGERWYLNAVDVHGTRWHGTSPGPGMYCRMRRSA